MGASSEPDIERTSDAESSTPIDIEMAQFMREEDSLHTTANAPPSYDSSAPLLIEENEDTSAEGQGVDKQSAWGWRIWLRVIFVLFPFFAVLLSMPILCISGVDELGVSVLAFFLLLTMYGVAALFAVSMTTKHPSTYPHRILPLSTQYFFWLNLSLQIPFAFSDSSKPKKTNSNSSSDDSFVGWAFSWHFWLCHIAFIGIVYWWLKGMPDGLFVRWRVATEFGQKIGQGDGLMKLVDCLNEVPQIRDEERDATVGDVVSCLVGMGVNATGFIKGVD
jgi:hypothetical protein